MSAEELAGKIGFIVRRGGQGAFDAVASLIRGAISDARDAALRDAREEIELYKAALEAARADHVRAQDHYVVVKDELARLRDHSAAKAAEHARPEGARRDLFVDGEFVSHSGLLLPFKIDCDALTDTDLGTLAAAIARRVGQFSAVHGIPRGGTRLAYALTQYCTGSIDDPLLIVDDVLTTGASMEEAHRSNTIGAVIFARGPIPDWITPLFVET
jgi:hypothetical protein